MTMKNIIRKVFILSVIVVMVTGVSGCKSKKVKDNEYTTTEQITLEVDGKEGIRFVFSGKNIVTFEIRNENLSNIYSEILESTSTEPVCELEFLFKKNGETEFRAIINKNGGKLESFTEETDDDYWKCETGSTLKSWITVNTGMPTISMQFAYFDLCSLLEECDSFEVYFHNNSTGTKEILQDSDSKLKDFIQKGSVSNRNVMNITFDYIDEESVKIDIAGGVFKDDGNFIIKMCREEDSLIKPTKYIKFTKINSLGEIETGEAIYNDEKYFGKLMEEVTEEEIANYLSLMKGKIEIGEINYDENGKEVLVPHKNSNENVYNAVVVGDRNDYSVLVVYSGIEGYFDGYTRFTGYIGSNFKDLVYIVRKKAD